MIPKPANDLASIKSHSRMHTLAHHPRNCLKNVTIMNPHSDGSSQRIPLGPSQWICLVHLHSGSPSDGPSALVVPLGMAALRGPGWSKADGAAVEISPSLRRQTFGDRKSGHTPALRRSHFGEPGAGESETATSQFDISMAARPQTRKRELLDPRARPASPLIQEHDPVNRVPAHSEHEV